MKKILLISSLICLFSCEKDEVLITSDEPSTSLIEEYIEHYSSIAAGKFGWNDGEIYYLKPARWKNGGFKGSDKIDVFFHESFDDVNAKNELISFFSVIDNIIEDENIKFNVVNSINDADITIVLGADTHKTIYDSEPNYDFEGQAFLRNEEELADEYNIVNPDICKIVEGSFWVERYDDLLIKHEFLHVLGFLHTPKSNSMMNHLINKMANLKDEDEKAIYLKYNNDLSQEVIAVPGATGFPDWLFTNEEYEIHLDNVRLTLENRFNL